MKYFIIIFLGLVFLLLLGCDKSLTPREYVGWVEDETNGLRVSTQHGNYIVSAQYKPLDYLAIQQLRKEMLTEEELLMGREEFEGLVYFTLQIGLANGRGDVLKEQLTSEAEYYERIRYFSFDIQQDLSLAYGGHLVKPCVLSHFERNYGIRPTITLVLAFEEGGMSEDMTLVYEDKILGIGKIYLPIRAKDIKEIPLLSLLK